MARAWFVGHDVVVVVVVVVVIVVVVVRKIFTKTRKNTLTPYHTRVFMIDQHHD